MSKLYYFKDFSKRKFTSTSGKDINYDCSKLSLVERLVISAYITLLKNGTDASSLKTAERQQTLARIIYDYDGYQTTKNFNDFDEAVTNIFISHVELLHYIKDNIKSVQSGKKDRMMYVIQIDTEEIFLVKSTGKSICPIAWKAAALAASNSSYDNREFKRLHFMHWSIDKLENETKEHVKNIRLNKGHIIERINNWADAVKEFRKKTYRIGKFEGDYFVIGKVEEETTSTEEPKEEPKEEVVKPPKKVKTVKKVKTEEELDEEEENFKSKEEMKSMIKLKYDDSDDFSLYEGSDWLQYYYARMEEKKDLHTAPKRKKFIEALHKVVMKEFDVNNKIDKIVKKLGIKKELIEKALNGGYFDDKDGGLAMKQTIIAELKKIKDDVLDIYREEELQVYNGHELYPLYGRMLMGFMAKAHPRIMAL